MFKYKGRIVLCHGVWLIVAPLTSVFIVAMPCYIGTRNDNLINTTHTPPSKPNNT